MKKNYLTLLAVLFAVATLHAQTCTTVNLPAPQSWVPSNYYTGATVGADGWINGMNVYLDKEKAMYFDQSASTNTLLVNCYVAFGMAYTANPAKVLTMRVYDGTSGTPGAQIASSTITMGQIMQDVATSSYTEFTFPTAVTLPVSKRFFVSIDLTNLQWSANTKDTLSIVSNSAGQTTPSAIWEKQSDNSWYQYGTAGSWNLNASLFIHPFLTTQASAATFTASSTNVCQGQEITLNAAGSTYQDTLLWEIPGSATPLLPSNPNPTVKFIQPGTYNVILYTIGGGCSLYRDDTVTITVRPSPSLSASANATICQGGSTTLTATTGAAVVWQPSTGLSSTNTLQVTATPNTNTTYIVTADSAGCTNTDTVSVTVVNEVTPSINIAADNGTSCLGAEVEFTATTQFGGTGYTIEWFVNNTPASNSTSTSYSTNALTNNAGIYAVLYSTEACASATTDTSNIINVTILSPVSSSTSLAICQGDSYNFNGTAINAAGTYTDTLVASNGCDSITTLTLSVNTLPQPTITADGNVLSTQTFDTYQWLLEGSDVPNATAQQYTATENGNYSVLVSDDNGCIATSTPVNITGVGIGNGIAAMNISLYPNPARNMVWVNVTEAMQITISNAEGRILVQHQLENGQQMLDIANLPAGILHVQFKGALGTAVTRLVITK